MNKRHASFLFLGTLLLCFSNALAEESARDDFFSEEESLDEEENSGSFEDSAADEPEPAHTKPAGKSSSVQSLETLRKKRRNPKQTASNLKNRIQGAKERIVNSKRKTLKRMGAVVAEMEKEIGPSATELEIRRRRLEEKRPKNCERGKRKREKRK